MHLAEIRWRGRHGRRGNRRTGGIRAGADLGPNWTPSASVWLRFRHVQAPGDGFHVVVGEVVPVSPPSRRNEGAPRHVASSLRGSPSLGRGEVWAPTPRAILPCCSTRATCRPSPSRSRCFSRWPARIRPRAWCMAFLVTSGAARSSNGCVGSRIAAPLESRTCCSAHGLRKAAATIAAENGATERQLMDMFGWRDPKMAGLYTRSARQKKLAGQGMPLIDLRREQSLPPAGGNRGRFQGQRRWYAERTSNLPRLACPLVPESSASTEFRHLGPAGCLRRPGFDCRNILWAISATGRRFQPFSRRSPR